MLSEAFTLVLQLPPLAFGPALPPAYVQPRELTCPVSELGRLREAPPPALRLRTVALNPGALQPVPPRHPVHPALQYLLVVGALGATGGTWSDQTWAQREWTALGGLAPVSLPPLAPMRSF